MNLGKILIIISLLASLIALIFNIISSKKKKFEKYVELFYACSTLAITSALFLLIYYQLTCNFSCAYVVKHISTDLEPIYRISALWSGQEGSFILWAFISMWIGFCIKSQKKPFSVYMVITIAILIFVYISNPFSMSKDIPLQGNGLNEALQNPWMIIHPPLVFVGYSAMAVLFSQSCFRIFNKKWMFISLLFLGMGIFTGSIWAYNALGWGGYWAWDPIENAALIPWLILITIVHKKKVSPHSTMIPFVLAIFGTFLARSGLLKEKSVHSYNASSMGIPIFLFFLSLFLVLCVWGIKNKVKYKAIKNSNLDKIILIFCNVTYLFLTAILIGTVLPIFSSSKTDISFYNVTALIFALICSVLLIIYMYPIAKKKICEMLIVTTILVIGVSVVTKYSSIMWLILLWIVVLPLVIKVASCKVMKNMWANIAHCGFMLVTIGSIISARFGENGILIEPEIVNTKGIKTNIIHNFLGDTVTTEGIKYVTKPFIYLFWIGGVLTIVGILGALCCCKKENKLNVILKKV